MTARFDMASLPYAPCSAGADLGDEGLAEGEDDVSVLVRILEDRVALVGIEFPAGGGDDFGVAIESFVGRHEIKNGSSALTLALSPRRGSRLADVDVHGAAKTGAAIGEGDEAAGKGRTLNLER